MDTVLLFSTLAPEIREALRPLVHVRHFEAGQAIFFQDELVDAIYIVGRGRVKVVRITPDGDEIILCIRQAGEYFCPVPLLDGRGHLGSAFAITPVEILCIERRSFLDLCKKYPELLTIVQSDCLGEVRYLLHRLETSFHRGLRERVIIALLDVFYSRNAGATPGQGVIFLTHQELAGLSGISRENVSRVLKGLERMGILRLQRGKIHILDASRLSRVLNSYQTERGENS